MGKQEANTVIKLSQFARQILLTIEKGLTLAKSFIKK